MKLFFCHKSDALTFTINFLLLLDKNFFCTHFTFFVVNQMKTAVKRSNTYSNFKGKANKAKTKLTHPIEVEFFFSSVKRGAISLATRRRAARRCRRRVLSRKIQVRLRSCRSYRRRRPRLKCILLVKILILIDEKESFKLAPHLDRLFV